MDDKPISTKTTKKTTILDLFSTRLILTRSLNMFFQVKEEMKQLPLLTNGAG